MMKKLIIALFVCVLLSNNTGMAARRATSKTAAVCKRTITLPNGKYIYKNSAPLRSGGLGTPLIGYRIEPTLIGNYGSIKASSRISIYSSNGGQIASCPKASVEGASWRARCTINTRSLRSAAIRKGKHPSGYFKLNSSTCVVVPDIGRCYGSNKGLCNRTIK